MNTVQLLLLGIGVLCIIVVFALRGKVKQAKEGVKPPIAIYFAAAIPIFLAISLYFMQ